MRRKMTRQAALRILVLAGAATSLTGTVAYGQIPWLGYAMLMGGVTVIICAIAGALRDLEDKR